MSHHSKYTPTISDRVPMTEMEAKEAIKQRSELIAQLRAPLRLEQAAYKQAVADLEEGKLLDPESIYIRGPSQVLESRSKSTDSSKSKMSAYKDPVGLSSSKRKANDEGDVPKAKKQQKASSHNATNAGDRGEEEDTLALIGEGPAVKGKNRTGQTTLDVGRLQARKERNIRKPKSGFGKDVKRPDVVPERLVLQDKQPSNGTAIFSRGEAEKTSKTKPANISRDPGTDIETPKPVRSLVPSMGPPVAPKPQFEAESAFDQMSKRNKEALKIQTIQDVVDRKLRIEKVKEIRTNNNGRRASRQAAPKLRSTALSKNRDLAEPLAQPKDECERTPDWQRSFSTRPPKTTTSNLTITQIQMDENETMMLEKVGSIDRKRRAEGLEASMADLAKGNMGRISESRPTSTTRAHAPTQNLTAHEAIFGKGSKPRKPDIQRTPTPRYIRPHQQSRQITTSEHRDDAQGRAE